MQHVDTLEMDLNDACEEDQESEDHARKVASCYTDFEQIVGGLFKIDRKQIDAERRPDDGHRFHRNLIDALEKTTILGIKDTLGE